MEESPAAACFRLVRIASLRLADPLAALLNAGVGARAHSTVSAGYARDGIGGCELTVIVGHARRRRRGRRLPLHVKRRRDFFSRIGAEQRVAGAEAERGSREAQRERERQRGRDKTKTST